ncbi:hypothetical protein KDA_72240 [Dictyobacter alpinus]|uniref:WxL domain-containing protein n=1 Tax=Dictyobacter alpinus TaxID=2014873 RepID=A0A402BK89_9CHLR|nr:hypothetical protein [Dictyobacter alpinus]GCE31740.1 hypothetical protein KDA_72240 [Dictyobacter alpinus]
MNIGKSKWGKFCLSGILMGGIVLISSAMLALPTQAASPQLRSAELATPISCGVGTPCVIAPTIPVGGGSLSGSTNPMVVNNGSPVSIQPVDQTIGFSFGSNVSDLRGTAVGWNISASATALNFITATSDLFLDTPTPIIVTCSGGATCSSPGALTLAAGGVDLVPGPVALVSAPIGGGLGPYNISTLGNFNLPANASAGSASGGVISLTISSGP